MLKREVTVAVMNMLFRVLGSEIQQLAEGQRGRLSELAEKDADLLEVISEERPELMHWIPRIRRVRRFLDWNFIQNELTEAFREARFKREFSAYTGIDMSGTPNINLSRKERQWILKEAMRIIDMVK